MTSAAWHLDGELARRYAGGELGDVLAASVEQHLVACTDCRRLLAPHVDRPRLDRVWAEVLEEVEQPPRTLVERVLVPLGVSAPTARLVAAAPSLRGAWTIGVILVLVLALIVAHGADKGVALYLALAPLLPMAGVALAYGPAADPAYPIVAATPYSQLRLLAIRTAFVVATSLLPAVLVGLLMPGAAGLAVVWLLPALALATGTVALSTRVAPPVAAGLLTVTWLAVSLQGLAPRRDPLLATSAPVLVTCLLVLAVGATVLHHRRHDVAELVRRMQ